ncbi:MAG: hypothetical protein AB9Q18_05000 [Candidatus Reddybacter sp.]
MFQWSVTDDLKRSNFGLQIEQDAKHAEPEVIINYLKRHNGGSITIIRVRHRFNLPLELNHLSARFQIPPPNRD